MQAVPAMDQSVRTSANYAWHTRDLLGQGATGSVYRAIHKKTGELVAVKCFNASQNMTKSQTLNSREVTVMNKIRHDNIVRLIATEEDLRSKTQVLVMELCNSGSLQDVLTEPRNSTGMSEPDFRVVFKDISAGMQYLRKEGFIHRDVKPGNILRHVTVSGTCVYKITDFGAARALQEDEVFQSVYGTYEYLHPEIFGKGVMFHGGERNFSPVVDLWSVGATLYHCATGKLPFRLESGRGDLGALYRAISNKPPDAISGVQYEARGRVMYKSELPGECKLSKSFQTQLVKILQSILQVDPKMAPSFDEYFASVDRLLEMKAVHVFHVNTSILHEVLVNTTHPPDRAGYLVEQVRHYCGVRDGSPALWWMPRLGAEVLDYALDDNKDMEIPVTTVSNPMVLSCGNWLDGDKLGELKIVDVSERAGRNPTLDKDYTMAQTTQNWSHYVLHSVRQLQRSVLSLDHSACVLGAIIQKAYAETVDTYKSHYSSLSQLLKIWNSMSAFLKPQAENYRQILDALHVEPQESSRSSEAVQKLSAQCDAGIAKVLQQGQACMGAFTRLEAPNKVFRWNAVDPLASVQKSEQDMLIMMDNVAALTRKFYSDRRAQRHQTLTPHDMAMHKTEKDHLLKVTREIQSQNAVCAAIRNELYNKLKHLWVKSEAYLDMLRHLGDSSTRLGAEVNIHQNTMTKLVEKSQESFAELQERSLKRVRTVFDVSVREQQAVSISMDGDTRQRMEQLHQLIGTLYESYNSLKQEVKLYELLVSKMPKDPA